MRIRPVLPWGGEKPLRGVIFLFPVLILTFLRVIPVYMGIYLGFGTVLSGNNGEYPENKVEKQR